MSRRPSYLELEFDPSAPTELVYRGLSSLVDLTLTTHGASVARLSAADAALRELLSCVGRSGQVSLARLDHGGGTTTLHVDFRSTDPLLIDDTSRAILAAGFLDCRFGDTRIDVDMIPADGRLDEY